MIRTQRLTLKMLKLVSITAKSNTKTKLKVEVERMPWLKTGKVRTNLRFLSYKVKKL